jgi:hypothetical protein
MSGIWEESCERDWKMRTERGSWFDDPKVLDDWNVDNKKGRAISAPAFAPPSNDI